MEGHFELKRTLLRRQWYWVFIANNGKQIFRSSETYFNKRDCTDSIPQLAGQPREWREYA